MAAAPQTKLIVLNLKAGMPTVEQAKRRLLESLYAPRGASGPVVKIIHGYGSTGTGGAIRSAIRELMAQWQREGKCSSLLREKTGVFSTRARRICGSDMHFSVRTKISIAGMQA
jgi:hypothetical protein